DPRGRPSARTADDSSPGPATVRASACSVPAPSTETSRPLEEALDPSLILLASLRLDAHERDLAGAEGPRDPRQRSSGRVHVGEAGAWRPPMNQSPCQGRAA